MYRIARLARAWWRLNTIVFTRIERAVPWDPWVVATWILAAWTVILVATGHGAAAAPFAVASLALPALRWATRS